MEIQKKIIYIHRYLRNHNNLRSVAVHHRLQRSILGVSWRVKLTNEEIRGRTGQQTIDSILTEQRLRWLGHILRMDHQRPSQQALYWKVPGYKRDQADQEQIGEV